MRATSGFQITNALLNNTLIKVTKLIIKLQLLSHQLRTYYRGNFEDFNANLTLLEN